MDGINDKLLLFRSFCNYCLMHSIVFERSFWGKINSSEYLPFWVTSHRTSIPWAWWHAMQISWQLLVILQLKDKLLCNAIGLGMKVRLLGCLLSVENMEATSPRVGINLHTSGPPVPSNGESSCIRKPFFQDKLLYSSIMIYLTHAAQSQTSQYISFLILFPHLTQLIFMEGLFIEQYYLFFIRAVDSRMSCFPVWHDFW